MIRFRLSLIAFVFSSGVVARADDAAPVIVKVSTVPESTEDLIVGSRVRLIVDVLGRDGWANVPTLPTVDVPGAIVFLPDGQSTRLNDTNDGESYSGQRNEWWVYPRRIGELVIPAIEFDVAIQTFDPKKDSITISKATDTITLNVVAPTGFDSAAQDIVVTSDLSIAQAWQGDVDKVKVGDGITRTITRTIQGSPPLVLPPIEFASVDGATQYVKQPTTQIQSERGEVTGTRIDSVTYVFKRSGEVALPPIELAWFDTETNKRRTDTQDGLVLSVASVPVVSSGMRSGDQQGRSLAVVVGLLMLPILTISACVASRHRLLAWWERRKYSERIVYRQLRRAMSSGDVSKSVRTLRQWISTQHPRTPMTCEQFFQSHLPDDTTTGLDRLYDAIDAGENRTDLSMLFRAVDRARSDAQSQIASSKDSIWNGRVLMPLNPVPRSTNGPR